MPSFHTKTIGAILEPVAQQVSELVILHEASEDGSAMPDLSAQIAVVNAAVQNLVRVGRETTNSSKDQILKQDMPPALVRVEASSSGLLEASQLLREDTYSVVARKKLIEGARGILGGTAQLLLVFDQAEVRKILVRCQNVLEYIPVAEVIEVMPDLVTFIKNLTPGLTAMASMVSNRIQDLTFQIHRELLQKHLDSAKNAVPLLMSSIKITITTINAGGRGLREAQENRNFVISKMCYDIREIMRVLQLTTYDEEEWAMDDITVLKKAQDNIASQMDQAKDWLENPNAAPGGVGELALRQILTNARKVADRVKEPYASQIGEAVDELTQMTDRLADLRAKGQGNSPEALQLSKAISNKLATLQSLVNDATQDAIRNGTGKPANTLTGKMEQAQAWLANPVMGKVGQKAIEGLVLEGRKVAQTLTGPEKQELEQLCNDVDSLYKQLCDLVRSGKGNTPEAQAIRQQLARKLQELQSKIEKALATQVVDSFMDPLGPLKQLEKAAKAPADAPQREQMYESKATIFLKHGDQMVDTARAVADAGSCPDKKVVGELKATANEVAEMTPQIVYAGKIVLSHPDNAAASENFDQLSKQYQDKVEKLTSAVDAATDAVEFIKASEESIKKDSAAASEAIKQRSPTDVVQKGSNIARKANRIVVVANKEADNSEDPEFVGKVKDATKKLEGSISDSVKAAKGVAMNPSDPGAQNNWYKSNGELLIDIERVKRPLIVVIPIEQQTPGPAELPVQAANQANLQSAAPQRSMYTANAPQYQQPAGTVQASPYAPKREGTSATPGQGDDFLRPQYVGSASRPLEQAPPVPPPPPTFSQATPKRDAGLRAPSHSTPNTQQTAAPLLQEKSDPDYFPPPPPSFLRDDPTQVTSVAQPASTPPVNIVTHSQPLHASQEPMVMAHTLPVAQAAPSPQQLAPTHQQFAPNPQQFAQTAQQFSPTPQQFAPTPEQPGTTLPPSPLNASLSSASPEIVPEVQHISQHAPETLHHPSVTSDLALTSGPPVTFDPTTVTQGRAPGQSTLSQPQHAALSSGAVLAMDQSVPPNSAPSPQRENQNIPHHQNQLQHPGFTSDPTLTFDPSSASGLAISQQNPVHVNQRAPSHPSSYMAPSVSSTPPKASPSPLPSALYQQAHPSQHDFQLSSDHPSQHAPDHYRSSVHVSLHPAAEDSLHAPQKSLPSHAYPSSQPTPLHGTSPSSYQPASASSKKPDYYQGASLYGPGSQSAAPAGIPPRTTSQASQRPPQQQPLTVDTGVPYSPLVRSPYDQQQYAPFSSNRSPGRSPRQFLVDVEAFVTAFDPVTQNGHAPSPHSFSPSPLSPIPNQFFELAHQPPPAPPPPVPRRIISREAKPPAQLQDNVGTVRNVVQVNAEPPPPPPPEEPPLPPPPDISALSISQEESAPPRPPLPEGQMPPPRPPPPEEEEEANLPKPQWQIDEPIMKAAYDLHQEAQKWSSKGNDLIAAAKKMALLMAEMSRYVRGEGGSKKGLIDCAKAIAAASSEVTKLATEIARQCTDKRIRMNLMQVCERIPTIATQLKIISTVKATLLGEPGSEDEIEATEVLVGNAQNLMQAVKETVRSAEAASIKIRTDAGALSKK